MPEHLVLWTLLAVVLMVSALASGLVERAPVSFPIIFLGLGFLVGARGLNLISVNPDDPTLETVAVLTLALALFLDAVKLRFDEIGSDWRVPMLSLGPGTLLIISCVAFVSYLLLNTTPVQSLLLGAVLASTDPVVLRDVIRDERIPRPVRRALSIEAGTNDLIVLPIVLVLIAVARAETEGVSGWLIFLARILILSPLVGLVVGNVGARLMSAADDRFSIRREYQALYGIGLVLFAYVAGQLVGGDGFLSAFFAGFAVAISSYELCDCFLEYGEASAEMAMLFAFILFGAALSTLVDTVPLLPALILAVIVIGLARPLILNLVLYRANISNSARAFIGWFGPRGLNSLLLALLVVRDGVPEAERLLAITGVVVVCSVLAHGATATPLSAWYARRVGRNVLSEERESTAAGLFRVDPVDVPRITAAEVADRLKDSNPPIILDVRTRSALAEDGTQIPGSVQVLPDQISRWAADQEERGRLVVAYCT